MVDIKVLAGCLPAVSYWGSSTLSQFPRLQWVISRCALRIVYL